MKLSCLPVSLFPDLASGRLSAGEWCRIAAGLGLDGADLSVAHLRSREKTVLSGLRQEAADAGVEIPMLVTYSDFTHPSAAYRAQQNAELAAWIDVAAHLGTRFVRVTAGQAHPGVGEIEGLSWAVAGLTAALAHAHASGVRLLYENHTRGSVWTHNDFTHAPGRFLEVVRRIRGTGVGVLFDTANTLKAGADPEAVLEAVIDLVGAVHLSDTARAGAWEPAVIGTGAAPLPSLVARICRSGFDGWISIEEASRSGQEGFRRAVVCADELWTASGGTRRARAARM